MQRRWARAGHDQRAHIPVAPGTELARYCAFVSSQVKVYSSRRQESHVRGGGSRAQGLVRAGAVPTTPRSLERARQEMSHLSVVLWMRPGIFLFVFSLTKQLRTCLLSKRVEILRQKSKWGRALWELCRYCGQSGADWGRFGRGVRHQVLEVWWGAGALSNKRGPAVLCS